MNCQTCRERMAELADARLGEKDAAEMRAHMGACPECAREFDTISRTLEALDSVPHGAPSPRLRARVTGLIETEKLTLRDRAAWASSIRTAASEHPRQARPWWPALLQSLAACALVALGFAFGERSASQRQIADLRARVDTMGQLVEQSVLQKQATGDRLETVMTAAGSRKPDERLINGLINTMAFDNSVNVRLNALNALYVHANQDVVRAGVLACLSREPSPLVQVSMIDFLVASKAREAAPELRRLSQDEHADADVRESARRAMDLL
jgi:hypothetical protein